MMNILEQEDIIKGLPDQALMQEAQMPSGEVPQYLVISEIQRRSDMRKRYKAEQEQMPQGTIKDKVMQEGIMASMPPQMAMAPQMAQRMPNMPPPQMPPQGIEQVMPPQMMSGGGAIRMSEGRQAERGLNLDPLRERLGALGDAIKGIESSNRQTDSSGNVLRSVKGAVGLMQVMPATAAQPGYGVPSIFDLAKSAGIEVNEDQVTFDTEVLEDGRIKRTPTPEAVAEADRLLENPRLNEAFGLRYLDAMVDEFDGDLDRIGIAYNAGPKVAERWDGDPESLKKETRDYIGKLKSSADVVSARDSLVGLEQQDTPAEGSLEAQAQIVDAIQRRRAAPPPRSAEEQLLDMAGGRPMPVVGQGAPRESVSVMPLPQPPAVSFDNSFDPTMAVPNISMPSLPPAPQPELSFVTPQEGPRERRESAQRGMDMMLDQLDQNDRQRRLEAVPELIKLYQDMGLNPTQASNLALGIGPRGPASPFGAPPADRSGVAALPTGSDIADAMAAYMGRTGMPPTELPTGPTSADLTGIVPTQRGQIPLGVAATLNTDPAIADARAAYMGRINMPPAGDARMQATDSAEVQSEPRGIFSQTPSQLIANADASTARGLIPGLTDRDVGFGRGMVSDNSLGRTIADNVAGVIAESEIDPRLTGRTQVAESGVFSQTPSQLMTDARMQAIADARASYMGRTGMPPVGSDAGRFETPTGSVAAGDLADSEAPPVDANGIAPEAPIINALVNTPSGDRSNPKYSLDQLIKPTDEMLAGLDDPTLSPIRFDQNLGLEPEKTTSVTPPEFNIADILDESRRMNKANILMQLGAGIAAGDVSKGLSAAGAAAASGAKEIRDLDMRSRLAKYQAGREDQKRETAASQFDRQMTLLEEKVKNAAKYGGSATTASLIRVLGDEAQVLRQNLNYINKEEDGGTKYQNALDRLESLQQTIYSLGGINMPTEGTTGFYDLDLGTVGSSAIVGAGG